MTKIQRFYCSILDKKKFAKKCGISQPYFSQICNRRRTPSAAVAARIAKASRGAISELTILYDK